MLWVFLMIKQSDIEIKLLIQFTKKIPALKEIKQMKILKNPEHLEVDLWILKMT